MQDLKIPILLRVHAYHMRGMILNGLHILHRQRHERRPSHAALRDTLRIHVEHSRAKLCDALLHGILRTVTKRSHRDDRGHANHHAQHGQQRSHRIDS